MDPTQLAAVLAALVLVASMFSVELGISVALLELGLGVIAGNLFNLDPNTDWLVFIASFASIVLTFLAGAEVDPSDFRERFWASISIGVVSFIGPFIVATLISYELLGWTLKASLIAGTALSTTSLAVVYAVLVESGLNATRVGKFLMSACFVTDMGTALALSAIFIKPNAWFPLFLFVSVGLIVLLPRISPWFFARYGDRVIEPEIKLVFFCLFVLMVLADAAQGHAVLPAFVLGLVMARFYEDHQQEQERLRVVAFAFLTPFFFLRGGMNVSLGAVFANVGVLLVLVAAKMVPKLGLVYPLARRFQRREAPFITLLMSTGLTFGTISSLYGLNAHIIDRTQFSLLITRRAVGDRADGDRAALVLARPGQATPPPRAAGLSGRLHDGTMSDHERAVVAAIIAGASALLGIAGYLLFRAVPVVGFALMALGGLGAVEAVLVGLGLTRRS